MLTIRSYNLSESFDSCSNTKMYGDNYNIQTDNALKPIINKTCEMYLFLQLSLLLLGHAHANLLFLST